MKNSAFNVHYPAQAIYELSAKE